MAAGVGRIIAPNREESFGRRIALISMTVSAALAVSKILVGLRAGSAAVLSDGFEGTGDVLSSGIVFAGLVLASKPPDYEHPYGHGRYETLAALAVGALLLLTGAATLWHAATAPPETPVLASYVLYPLLAAILCKVILSTVKFRVGRSIASSSLQADAWHDVTDLLSTSVALIAVGLSLYDPARFAWSDRFGAIAIGGIIISLSIRVVRRTVDQLVDTMPEPERLAAIRNTALSVPGTLGIEKCYARRTGMKFHVDLHLEVDPEMTVRQSHEIAAQVRAAIKDNLAWVADVLVHVEPSPLSAARAILLERRVGK